MKGLEWVGCAAMLLTCGALAQTTQQQGISGPAPSSSPPLSPPEVTELPPVAVIGATPLQGSGIDRNKVPAATNVVTSRDVVRTGVPNMLGSLDTQVPGVTLDHAQGNSFQPNLIYRGFQASPLSGNAQGLAVYLNGARFNQPFGDTVNWDLIPDEAIEEINLVGSNPAFGLNALGGALSVRLKDGFSFDGAELDVSGGSFGRIEGNFQYGRQADNTAAYIAGTMLNENGWRDHSPSQLRQIYSDVGWRGERAEVHLNIAAADNILVGNGTTPVELLDIDRAALFTYPDETRNKYLRVTLTGNYDVSSSTSLQAAVYYSNLSQRTRNGDAGNQEVCGNPSFVCLQNGPVLTDRGGNPIPNFIQSSPYFTQFGFANFSNGGPYAALNRTATDTNGYGVSLQLTNRSPVFERPNHLVAGASLDGGDTSFSASTELGGFSLDRGFLGPGIVLDQADGSITPVRVHSANRYYGLFAADTLDATDRLAVTVSGRLNVAEIGLRDQIGTALSGEHSYTRFNPAAGLTYRLAPWATAYFGYAEANRAPTPAELSCASPAAPCSLTNFFVGDPDLKQVVAHTFEGGLRGTLTPLEGARLGWHAGLFRTDSDDDIAFTSSPVLGRAFFSNIGSTRRQGIEAGVTYRTDRLSAWIEYAYTDATSQSSLTLNSRNNPLADANGQINVRPGNRLPGVPQHTLKLGADYALTEAWSIGASGRIASGQYLFGDESNLTPTTGAYAVFNMHTSYQVAKNFQLFGLVENAFNARYATYGTFSPVGDVPIIQVPNATNSRSLAPGAPVAGYGGVRVTF